MKIRLAGFSASLLLLGAGLAWSQPPGEGLMRMDSDGDGRISREEFKPPAERRGRGPFARFDDNDDGMVTRAEMEAGVTAQAERMREEVLTQFDRMDVDGNGVVTMDEAAGHAFTRLDSDGDGYVTAEEAAAMPDRRGGPHHKPRHEDRQSRSDS